MIFLCSTAQSFPQVTMQKDESLTSFRDVISMQRFVQEVRGLQTPAIYEKTKHYARNKDKRWEEFVGDMTEQSRMNHVQWCEVFSADLLLLRGYTITFEQNMIGRGADLDHGLGSQEHELKKLHMLLYQGENAVFNEDMYEDVLLRSARRLRTLIGWAQEVIHQALCISG